MTLLAQVRTALRAVAERERAAPMQAYMKSTMPYLGVTAPNVKAACKQVFASYAFESAEAWRADVLALWRDAKYREERYAAIRLTGAPRAKPFQTLDAVALYETLVTEGAWWDYVDEIASHRIGPLLAAYPVEMAKRVRSWSTGDNLWLRRTSILCQLGFGKTTDTKLLYACIEPSLDSKEFFLRKAIGWALRQYARTDPAAVKRYVKKYEQRLSGLSKREALKHL